MKLLRRQHFVLLEILIALSLVSLAALPLALSPLHALKKEREMVDEIECERIAECTFAEIKELLLKNDIPWEELSTSEKRKKVYPLKDFSLCLPGFSKREVKRNFRIYCPHEKEGQNGAIYRHLLIAVELKPPSLKKSNVYEYHLFAQKKG